MPYTVNYNKLGFVVLKYTGIVTQQEAGESSVEGIALAKKHDVYLYLADHFNSAVVLPIEKVYDLMDVLAEKTDLSRKAKLAIILPAAGEEARNNLEYFGTVASNQGWMVAAFDTYEAAVDWLMG